MIHLSNVYKSFESRTSESRTQGPGVLKALENINLDLNAGQSLAVIGPSGCGKTTLLYLLAGLMRPSSGQIQIRGTEVRGTSKKTAFILQNYGLLPWKTVQQNIGLGMKIQGTKKPERISRTREMVVEMGLYAHQDCYPSVLSGGEKQRVAIARALSLRPEIMLMDEPLSALDTLTREHLQDRLAGLWHKNAFTMILVTHNIEEAVFLGQKIMVMSPRPGKISAMLDNRHTAEKGFRTSEKFFGVCKEVRSFVEMS